MFSPCFDFYPLQNAVQAVHDQISDGNSTTNRSTVPKQTKVASPSSHRSTTTTTTHQPAATKKHTPPTTSSSKRNHSSDDSDDIRLIKSISGSMETRKNTGLVLYISLWIVLVGNLIELFRFH